jgi:hypothetical protein
MNDSAAVPSAASSQFGGGTVTRQEVHMRRVEMRGYARSDGLFEVEGRVIDTKSRDFNAPTGSRSVRANEPIHDMGVRLIFDEDMTVHAVETFTNASPFAICADGGSALQSVVGLRMVRGWSAEVKKRLSGPRACTHLMEMLIPLATTAFQTLAEIRLARPQLTRRAGLTSSTLATPSVRRARSCCATGRHSTSPRHRSRSRALWLAACSSIRNQDRPTGVRTPVRWRPALE